MFHRTCLQNVICLNFENELKTDEYIKSKINKYVIKNWQHLLITLILNEFMISKNKDNIINEFNFNIAQEKNVF